jgi:hypothetical protein
MQICCEDFSGKSPGLPCILRIQPAKHSNVIQVTDFSGVQNARVMGSCQFPHKFQRKA